MMDALNQQAKITDNNIRFMVEAQTRASAILIEEKTLIIANLQQQVQSLTQQIELLNRAIKDQNEKINKLSKKG